MLSEVTTPAYQLTPRLTCANIWDKLKSLGKEKIHYFIINAKSFSINVILRKLAKKKMPKDDLPVWKAGTLRWMKPVVRGAAEEMPSAL